MYIYNYFIILLGVGVSYNIRFNTIQDTKKSKIDLWYDSRFDNYASKNFNIWIQKTFEEKSFISSS